MAGYVSASEWVKGIGLSVAASIIGGASKLAIRKSWIMVENLPEDIHEASPDDRRMIRVWRAARRFARSMFWGEETKISETKTVEMEASQGDSQQNENRRAYGSSGAYSPPVSPGATTADTTEQGANFSSRSILSEFSQSPNTVLRSAAIALRLAGMVGMTILNPLCCVLAMNYASPSILAPFSGLTLVWIVLFAEPLIGEAPTRQQVLAAGLIIFGEVVVALFGDHTNDEGVSLDDLADSYRNVGFICYLLLMLFWMGFLTYLMINSPNPVVRRFAWGTSGGSITGLQNFLKDSLTVIKAPRAEDGHLVWFFFLFVALAILTALGGLLLLTACMKRYDATFSSAMFVGSFVVSASVMSAVHYRTFEALDGPLSYVLYPLGLVVLLVGVLILVQETADNPSENSPRLSETPPPNSQEHGGDEVIGNGPSIPASDSFHAQVEPNQNKTNRTSSNEMKRPLVTNGVVV